MTSGSRCFSDLMIAYESRCAELGIIENHELIDRIICTYVDVKGLFENLKDLVGNTRSVMRRCMGIGKMDTDRMPVNVSKVCGTWIARVPAWHLRWSRISCSSSCPSGLTSPL